MGFYQRAVENGAVECMRQGIQPDIATIRVLRSIRWMLRMGTESLRLDEYRSMNISESMYLLESVEDKLTRLLLVPDPPLAVRKRIAALEKQLIASYMPLTEDEIARACQHSADKSLWHLAAEIERLDEAEFYRAHADASLFADDDYAGDEVVDWSSGRRDIDAARLASEASRSVLHSHICHVTSARPTELHVQGGIATLDDGVSVAEARLPSWADPLGRRHDYDSVAREIEAVTYADFQTWLRNFEDDIVLGWEGRRLDCILHRFLRQFTGIRWDCLFIESETATVESPIFTRSATARLPEFAAYVSTITTYPSVPGLYSGMPITAGWLRRVLHGK